MGLLQAVVITALLLQTLCHVRGEDDSSCLEQFKNSVKDPQGYLSNWNFQNGSTGSVCSFNGVTCWNQQENKIVSLKLGSAGLSGSFPNGLQSCKSLTGLDLDGNSFTGPIPSDICSQMPYLTSLDLSSNQITGQIPDLSHCTYLNVLNLQQNKLSGSIPLGIGGLTRLKTLNLAQNSLSGTIPNDLKDQSSSVFSGNPDLCGPPLGKCNSKNHLGVILIAAIAAVAVVAMVSAVIIWFLLFRRPRKGGAYLRDEDKWIRRIKAPKSVTVSMFEKPLVRLKLSDLMAATNNFSKDNIISSGRTGTVYKATLPDGSMLAIKRLQMSSHSEKEFRAEMSTLGHLRHRNLVPLLGYCVAGGEKLLVYKHMLHGSLRSALHEVPEEYKLDWTNRLKVGIGSARGFAWLHHSCNPRIIHRNISATSILLDDDYEPRITDFGLARLMNPVDTHISTFVNGDFGDVGYVAPEYIRTLVATMKGDVYSFGVVLLELVTGQKAMEVFGVSNFKGNLPEWISYLSSNRRLEEAIDISLKGKGSDEELNQFLRVACSCIQQTPKERPTMYEVYQLLRAIGEKYNLTDENDEIPLWTESNGDYTSELIVASAEK